MLFFALRIILEVKKSKTTQANCPIREIKIKNEQE
jgi:hypothetical protein